MHCVERDVIEDGESEDVVESQGGMRVPNGHGCSLFSLVVAVLGQAWLEPKWLRSLSDTYRRPSKLRND